MVSDVITVHKQDVWLCDASTPSQQIQPGLGSRERLLSQLETGIMGRIDTIASRTTKFTGARAWRWRLADSGHCRADWLQNLWTLGSPKLGVIPRPLHELFYVLLHASLRSFCCLHCEYHTTSFVALCVLPSMIDNNRLVYCLVVLAFM